MLGYLSLDIICSSKLTVFLELRSQKAVRFSEQVMSADKYPSIFSRQMEAIVYIFPNFRNCACCEKYLKDNKHYSLHLTLKICWDICPWTLSACSESEYPSIFSRQMEAIVYISLNFLNILVFSNFLGNF